MRTALDVIHRVQHDLLFDASQVVIGFTDRLAQGGVRESPLSAMNFDEDIAALDDRVDLALPQHRILYISYHEFGSIWCKKDRIDRIFGSTGNETVIAELQRQAEAAELQQHADEVVRLEAANVAARNHPPGDVAFQRPPREIAAADRPNAFYCLAVRNRAIVQTAEAVQAAICDREPRLAGVLVKPNALHVTLAVTRLSHQRDEQAGKAILGSLAARLLELVPPHDPLIISGVRAFRDRVLYAAVQPHAGLATFVAELRAALMAAGLEAADHEMFTAHMTLCKLSRPLCREMGQIPRECWYGCSAVNFGAVHVGGAELCWMSMTGAAINAGDGSGLKTGFRYRRVASSRLGRLLTAAELLDLSNEPVVPLDGGTDALATSCANVRELHVFDFDGTLFDTMGPHDGRQAYTALTGTAWPHRSWLDQPNSLRAPLRVRPGRALAALRASLQRQRDAAVPGTVRAIVLTGRFGSVRAEVAAALEAHGVQLPATSLHFRPDGERGAFKGTTLAQLLQHTYVGARRITIWEDNHDALAEYAAVALALREHSPAREIRLVDATSLPSPPASTFGGACAAFLAERLATSCGRVDARPADVALVLDCWRAVLSSVVGHAALPATTDISSFALRFGSQPLGRRDRDLDLCLLAPLINGADAADAVWLLSRLHAYLIACGVECTHFAADARTPRLALRLAQTPHENAYKFCDVDIVVARVRLSPDADLMRSPSGASSRDHMQRLAGLGAVAADTASLEALAGPLRLATLRVRLVATGIRESVVCIALDTIDILLAPYAVTGALFHCCRTFHLLDLIASAVEHGAGGAHDADSLVTTTINYAADLDASAWDRRLAPAVPPLYRQRVAQAFRELNSRAPASPLNTDSLWALAVPAFPPTPPPGFITAQLVARSTDVRLQFKLSHVLHARAGRATLTLLTAGRDIAPLPLINGDETTVRLAVYERQSARMQLEAAFEPALTELRLLAADMADASDATIEFTWLRPVPKPPSAAAKGHTETRPLTDLLPMAPPTTSTLLMTPIAARRVNSAPADPMSLPLIGVA